MKSENGCGRIQKIGKGTLIPLGIVAVLLAAAWSVATERSEIRQGINTNSATIAAMSSDMDSLKASMRRIEIELGTFPKDSP